MKKDKTKQSIGKTIKRYEESPLERVKNKKGLLALSLILWGWAIHSSDSVIGASIANSTSINIILLATLVGGLLLVLNVFLGGYIGYKSGYPVNVTSRLVFGSKGALIPNILTIITLAGWAGYSIGLTSEFFVSALNIPTNYHLIASVLFSVAFGTFVGLSTSIFGSKAIEIVSLISSPAMILILLFMSIKLVNSAGGWSELSVLQNASEGWQVASNKNPFLWIVGMTFTSWISIGLYSSDYFRFAKKWQHVLIAGAFSYIFGKVLVQILGAVASRATGTSDIFGVFAVVGAAFIGFIIYVFDNWTSIDTQVYSSGLSITNIFKIKRSTSTTIITVIAVILAVGGIYNYLLNYLLFIGTFVGPILGPVFADYYVSSKWIIKKDYSNPFKENIKPLRYPGVIAWLSGVAVAYYLKDFGLLGLNGIVVAFFIYLLIETFEKKRLYANS